MTKPTSKPPRRCWIHRWRTVGLCGLATLVEECKKCRWQRTFDGFLDVTRLMVPGTYKAVDRD